MSSVYNVTIPTYGQLNNAQTASYLLGNAQTDTISITPNNPYSGIIKFSNNISVANVYGTASWASNLIPSRYYITASNSDYATTAGNTITSSYLRYQPGGNTGTASYAILANSAVSSSYATNATNANTASYVNNQSIANCIFIGYIGSGTSNAVAYKSNGQISTITATWSGAVGVYTRRLTHNLGSGNYFVTLSSAGSTIGSIYSLTNIQSNYFDIDTNSNQNSFYFQIWSY
jgi:hypothetical protein